MPGRRLSPRGFTIIELLVVLAIILTAALVGFPALQKMAERSRLQGIVRQTAIHMKVAQQEAIKFGFPVVMKADLATSQVVVFANVDQDTNFAYQPDNTAAFRTVDYEVARLTLPYEFDVLFQGPPGENVVDGLTADGNGDQVAVFQPDGTVEDSGAFRIAHGQNFFEIRVEPKATAKVEIRKYHFSPPWGSKKGFFPAGRHKGTGKPLWQWY